MLGVVLVDLLRVVAFMQSRDLGGNEELGVRGIFGLGGFHETMGLHGWTNGVFLLFCPFYDS